MRATLERSTTIIARIMRAEGLTCRELAELTGLHCTTVSKIALGTNDFKVNELTAELLAEALYTPLRELFGPDDLSHLGRKPLTENSCTEHLPEEFWDCTPRTCTRCHLQLPVRGECDYCN